jgi:hypothetical protein
MKNVLAPTDFTSNSIKEAIQIVKGLNEKVNIVFFHAFQHPFFYNDLVRASAPYATLMTDELRQSCRQLKDQFPESIGSVTFSFMRGDTVALFRNFLDANSIDAIVCSEDYRYEKVHKDSVNPVPLFKRCGKQILQNLTVSHQRLQVTETEFRISPETIYN